MGHALTVMMAMGYPMATVFNQHHHHQAHHLRARHTQGHQLTTRARPQTGAAQTARTKADPPLPQPPPSPTPTARPTRASPSMDAPQ